MNDVSHKREPDEPAYSIESEVLGVAGALGITLEHFLYMLKFSSRITHERGNRRFHGYLFDVDTSDQGVWNVKGFQRLDGKPLVVVPRSARADPHCEKCHGSGTVTVYDSCPKCEGAGVIGNVNCVVCVKGFLESRIKCPACEQKAKLV